MLLAAAVVLLALVVVLVGALGSGSAGGGAGDVTLTGAPTVAGPSRASGAAGAGVGAGADAGAGSPSPGVPGTVASGAAAGSVVVHVAGAVRHAGIVRLPLGDRVTDAVDGAGGATDEADLSRVNLARVLVDGERVYVPSVGEAEPPQTLDGGVGPAPDGTGGAAAGGTGTGTGGGGGDPGAVVDLNTADQATLETLPGIGPSLAGRILAWRQEHGRFAAVEDLLDVSGIGDARFAELRDRVRV